MFTGPMFLDVPWTLALFAIGFAGVVVGFLWLRRLTTVDQAQVFRATAPGGRRWPAYAIGAGVAMLAVIAVILAIFYAS